MQVVHAAAAGAGPAAVAEAGIPKMVVLSTRVAAAAAVAKRRERKNGQSVVSTSRVRRQAEPRRFAYA
jgi:hypothetical protein